MNNTCEIIIHCGVNVAGNLQYVKQCIKVYSCGVHEFISKT